MKESRKSFTRLAEFRRKLEILGRSFVHQSSRNQRTQSSAPADSYYICKAQSAFIWLGQSGDGATEGGQAINFLVGLDQEIREEEQKQSNLRAHNEGGLSCLATAFGYIEYAIDKSTWPTLAALYTRTYWRRIWIIQELAMGLEWLTFLGTAMKSVRSH